MKIFLTGATGLLGNNVARRLLDQGYQVRCLVRGNKAPRSLEGLEVEIYEGDLSPATNWNDALEGVNAVVHCAAMIHIGWKRFDKAREVNVAATTALATESMKRKLRLVYISTVDTLAVSFDGIPVAEEQREPSNLPNCYVATKKEAEDAIQTLVAKGLNAVILHPGFLLGPWDWKPSSARMLISIAKRQIPAAPKGGCSVTDARNVAAGIQNALTTGKAGEHFILAGQNISYKDLFQKMAAVIGVNAPKITLGPIAAIVGCKIADFRSLLGFTESDFNSAMISMSQLNHYYTSQKAIQTLGYQPTDCDQAIQSAWEFVRKHHAASLE